ncbi:hypothetical protein KHM83_19060 [Fusibacter paucivorans]|uniref:Uncharacterized protein n=1 Tax=Fusibacter paucivorans TaxID=76009 RepID=A0ABS5PUD4_9FIRM|nr:hypothetical protein [Fusibacter paucivorans]MBS7528770.1 hypothetical protein [Fusibacter paucivorans]
MPEIMPDDFTVTFQYGVDQASQFSGIDTENETLQRDLVLDGLAIGHFTPDKEFLENIYNQLYEAQILTYPETFNPPYQDNPTAGVTKFVTPSNVYDLNIAYDNVSHHVYWHDENASTAEKAVRLHEALHEIIQSIEALDAFKALGEPNGGYD